MLKTFQKLSRTISQSPRKLGWWVAVPTAVSFGLHLAMVGGISYWTQKAQPPLFPVPVKIAFIEKKIEPPPKKTIPKPKPRPKVVKPASLRTKKPAKKSALKPKKKPQPVQGLLKENFQKSNTAPIVPIGNTLMQADEGKRLRADEVDDYIEDQSRDATPILSTIIKPKYTDAALDANAEGRIIVDLYVDENGEVQEAELRKRFGYGMDRLILRSAKRTMFRPRLNRYGQAVAGWAELSMRLLIE